MFIFLSLLENLREELSGIWIWCRTKNQNDCTLACLNLKLELRCCTELGLELCLKLVFTHRRITFMHRCTTYLSYYFWRF